LEKIVYASAFDETTVAEPCEPEETSSSGKASPDESNAERGRNVSECSAESCGYDPETILRPEDLDISGLELGGTSDYNGKEDKNSGQTGAGARSKQPRNTFYFYQS
jgi:hypothetical protein